MAKAIESKRTRELCRECTFGALGGIRLLWDTLGA